jgi:hypothetical protein
VFTTGKNGDDRAVPLNTQGVEGERSAFVHGDVARPACAAM